jgi:hypothetical protein
MQHRKRAKFLRQKAPKLADVQKKLAHQMASLHLGLARAQENNPSLAPAAKNPNNQKTPRVKPSKPRLVSDTSQI